MKRFVYAPRVEALIRLEEQGRLIDVTEDIISGSVSRRLNGMSTAQLQLQNKYGKYTGRDKNRSHNIIEPMDRIVIRMSRMGEPFLVFSGFVDEAPYDQLYPGPVSVAASDTIKLLQHTYFDPGLFAVQDFLRIQGWQYSTETGQLSDNSGGVKGGVGNFDRKGGVGDILREVLVEIGNWPREAIDIHNLPDKFISDIANLMAAAAEEASEQWELSAKYLESLYGITLETQDTGSSTGGSIPQGNVASVDVARGALQAGFKGENAITAVAIALAESSGRSDAMGYNGNNTIKTYDVGIWQINSLHTPGAPGGGTDLPKPPAAPVGQHYTLKMPQDWNATKASIPTAERTFIEQCFDPTFNAAKAFSIATNGTTFTPWSTFNKNLHVKHLPSAGKAIEDALKGTNSSFNAATLLRSNDDTTITQKSVKRTDTTKQTVAAKVIKVAEAELGVMEQSANWSPRISEYLRVAGYTTAAAWCGAFLAWVFDQAGRPLHQEISGIAGVANIQNYGKANNWIVNTPAPADIITFRANDGTTTNNHVGIVTRVADGKVHTIEGNTSDGVYRREYTLGTGDHTYLRVPGVGEAAGDSGYAGGGTPATGTVSDQRIAQIALGSIFSLQLATGDNSLSKILGGRRALANDVPLIEWVQTLTESSGRVFCTKPNGDFLSFHPDRFGFFKSRTPYFQIADVEVIDLNITKNDRELTTHVFTTGSMGNTLGQITPASHLGSMYATIEDPAFKFFIQSDNIDPISFLKRYGARPMQHPMPLVNHPMLLWMASWTKFAEQWSLQYSTSAQFTFMPELLPGGIVALGDRIQMFVEGVTHSFDLGGGFTTQAELSSPAALSPDYKGLPSAGLPQRERTDRSVLPE